MKFLKIAHTVVLLIVVAIPLAALVLLAYDDLESSKPRHIIRGCATCEKATNLAELDFENGSYVLIRFGLPEITSEMTGEILLEDYGIVQVYPTCVVIEEVECYTQKMYSRLQEKFGPDFYVKARSKAKTILASPDLLERRKSAVP